MIKTTPVVRDLLIINTALLVLAWVLNPFGIDLINILGLHYPKSPYYHPYQFLTHMFMHANFWHLFFNMYALWLFGSVLERVWGGKRFLIFYLLTGFGAAFLHTAVAWWQIHHFIVEANKFIYHPDLQAFLAFYKKYPDYFNPKAVSALLSQWELHPNSTAYATAVIPAIKEALMLRMNIPVVGASGAIFGLLLAFGMLFPETPLYIIFVPYPIKAKYFVIGYGLLELTNGVLNIPGDHIAHFAHLGGMIFGYLIIKYWDMRGIPRYGSGPNL